MNRRTLSSAFALATLTLLCAGCNDAPGKPKAGDIAARPEQITDFATLYGQNCAACHGNQGKNGAAIALANPIYLAVAGQANIQKVVSNGVAGTLMPPFAKSAGGMLTDAQIAILAQGMINSWGNPSALNSQTPPPYAASATGDVARGQQAFASTCARCHGADGTGLANKKNPGSIVDPSYLALIDDQGLRSIIIAGKPDQGMPDWRSAASADGAHPLTDQQITDIVAWLASHRVTSPGQPYQQHP
jgi:mono/diheme cytochrome c family protein